MPDITTDVSGLLEKSILITGTLASHEVQVCANETVDNADRNKQNKKNINLFFNKHTCNRETYGMLHFFISNL